MKLRMAWLTILCLALAAMPAFADYNNGPINGNIDAWTINFGFVVSDTFVADSTQVTGLMFGAREFPGDAMLSVDWSITSGENGGQVLGSGTAKVTDQFISLNSFGYQIDLITVTGLHVATVSNTQYWLNLQNAVTADGEVAFWDENSGVGCTSPGCPSKASENTLGTIPSEAFTINTSAGTTPEPNSFVLLGSGVLGLAGLLRRKLG
jgi:PEP-CTERM motif